MTVHVWLNNRGVDEVWIESTGVLSFEQFCADVRRRGLFSGEEDGGACWFPPHAIRKIDMGDGRTLDALAPSQTPAEVKL